MPTCMYICIRVCVCVRAHTCTTSAHAKAHLGWLLCSAVYCSLLHGLFSFHGWIPGGAPLAEDRWLCTEDAALGSSQKVLPEALLQATWGSFCHPGKIGKEKRSCVGVSKGIINTLDAPDRPTVGSAGLAGSGSEFSLFSWES